MSQITNILYISHGGGPLPLLGDPGHREMVACLQGFAEKLRKPSAILVISALGSPGADHHRGAQSRPDLRLLRFSA